ncbi:MAG: hypothetical protein WKF48_06085 [Solirubrobacteraceae bacterium]
MKKVVKSVKKRFKKVTTSVRKHPLISIGATLFTLMLIGGLITLVLVSGDDGSSDDTSASAPTNGDKQDKPDKPRKLLKVAPPAPVRSGPGTLDVARREGRFAIAQARGRIKQPNGISVTVSAAPKQPVTVDYQLSCYSQNGKTSSTKVASKRYRTTPPESRNLPLPLLGADECTVSVSAQLTEGSGRIKVIVKAS